MQLVSECVKASACATHLSERSVRSEGASRSEPSRRNAPSGSPPKNLRRTRTRSLALSTCVFVHAIPRKLIRAKPNSSVWRNEHQLQWIHGLVTWMCIIQAWEAAYGRRDSRVVALEAVGAGAARVHAAAVLCAPFVPQRPVH